MTTPAMYERHLLADLLHHVGPDAPTLCDGWTTRDLAAHVVLRERRVDAGIGILVQRFAGHTAKVQAKIAAGDWHELVERVRSGPPRWSPMRIPLVDRLVNTTEFFVHHEDVRRAQPDWTVRQLGDDLVEGLDAALRRSAKVFARRAPAGLVLEPDGGRARIVANDAEPAVIVRGPEGELTLFMYGRHEHARVGFDGPDDAVAAMRSARFGI
jgi:uncharacterized protein (TIGR03085 family)